MKSANELLPELRDWNHGKGVDALDYVFEFSTSEMVVALTSLFWPQFCAFETYVFRVGVNLENVRASEAAGWTGKQIEAAANYLGLGGLFAREPDSPLLEIGSISLGKFSSRRIRQNSQKIFLTVSS